MKLTILGCHSATPRDNARPTAQILEMKGHLFLIDCGEGTQMALRKNRVKFARIKHIFISHLHGDHVYGLIGLISTFCLLSRDADLTIYGPKGIKELILIQLKLAGVYTSFSLRFRESEINTPQILLEDDSLQVTTIPLEHRIFTHGFLFQEKPGDRHLDIVACQEYEIEKAYYRKIKQGHDYVKENGEVIPNTELTTDGDQPKSYAFCSDTVYKEDIVPQITDVTALYHESTFLKSHEHLCEKTKHSTAEQAAKIAKKATVGTLILGHYSSRYGDYELFRKEAQEVFEKTELAMDGKVFEF
ncbi:ribonuclease Z [Nonlabens dokdonensis]|uniref:Ribonuclease Z n=2 Tax=Nonlabens dokdonensis TaxID=328515 RepID=L7WEA0_NONDD|nr:ribonuclease Z [Nonlabens dokdonensis]AGC78434.1 ribonuclease Z [Nonlabens dokdonensis DSW-6]PZX38182.1 ribonuclease Z [Nonlabens dokdonensis]